MIVVVAGWKKNVLQYDVVMMKVLLKLVNEWTIISQSSSLNLFKYTISELHYKTIHTNVDTDTMGGQIIINKRPEPKVLF